MPVPEKIQEALDSLAANIPRIQAIGKFADAHIALVGAQILGQTVERALLARMAPLSANMKERLFNGYGPLCSYAGKVDIAFGLKIFVKESYDSLMAVNKIRVKFAHSNKYLNFDDPDISVMILKLPGLDDSIEMIRLRYMDWIARLNGALEVIEGAAAATGPTAAGWLFPSPKKSA